jgi:hypothetical protein
VNTRASSGILGQGNEVSVNTRAYRVIAKGTALLAGLVLASTAGAEDPCGLCDREIVINSALATCFLDHYQQFADRANGAIVVDLTDCEEARGVVEPLATPGAEVEEPDVQFMLTKLQLNCLKAKLEQPDIKLDPSARIELDSCG